MSEKDFAIGAVGVPQVGQASKKPCYLVTLDSYSGKNKVSTYFISIDKPDLLNGFVQMKGVYSSSSEEEINKRFGELINSSPKELIIDIMFPWHRIQSIKSLVFNANKVSTLVK